MGPAPAGLLQKLFGCGRVLARAMLPSTDRAMLAWKETTLRFLPSALAEAADRMRRRDFIALAGAAAVSIVPARAQALPVIGYLGGESPERYGSRLDAFRQGLA